MNRHRGRCSPHSCIVTPNIKTALLTDVKRIITLEFLELISVCTPTPCNFTCIYGFVCMGTSLGISPRTLQYIGPFYSVTIDFQLHFKCVFSVKSWKCELLWAFDVRPSDIVIKKVQDCFHDYFWGKSNVSIDVVSRQSFTRMNGRFVWKGGKLHFLFLLTYLYVYVCVVIVPVDANHVSL